MMSIKFLSIAAMVFLAGCVSGCEPPGPTTHDHQVVELDASEQTHVHLTMGGGELEVKGGAAKLLDADFSYNVPEWKPTVSHHSIGSAGKESDLEIEQASGNSHFSNTVNRWELTLNDAMPMDVVAHIGAGEAHMNLGSLNLRGVELHVGAGEVDMDLRGNPTKSYRVEVQGGVGSLQVHVPSSVAISATATGGIGDISVSGLEKRDGRWINPRAESSPVTIELDVKGGVGEIRILAD
jgi:hypothetical protein